MILDHQFHRFDTLRQMLSKFSYPVQIIIDAPLKFTHYLGNYASTQRSLVQQNELLKEQQFIQEGRLQQLSALESENERLRTLLKASLRMNEPLSVAEILKLDSDPFNHRILLNKGEKDQVYVGQPIIDAQGLIGEIIEVFNSSARAMLVTDASHAVPVENLRNGVRGIAVGTGSIDNLQLRYVPTTADLKIGDELVTSGLGGRFPQGFPVGIISQIEKDAGESFAVVKVKPLANLDRGRQVLLIKQQKNVEEKKVEDLNPKNQEMNAEALQK